MGRNLLVTKSALAILISGLTLPAIAEPVRTIVEFFSFNCVHCSNVNPKLVSYIARNNVKYMDINVDKDPNALTTDIMYYIATDAGVGPAFKSTYFKAINNGMPIYTSATLQYVTSEVRTPAMEQLMKSLTEKEHIKQKLAYTQSLINKYDIQVTPTFLINQTTLVEGEDVIDNMLGGSN